MRLAPGAKATHISLPSIDGSIFKTDSLEGNPFMLSFFRFASCPFCNLRVHELVRRYGVIQMAYYGSDEGDHLPFEQVKAFSMSGNA